MNDYLNNPLLLIIDMQNVYKEGQPWECKNYDNALSNVLALLDDGHFSQDNTRQHNTNTLHSLSTSNRSMEELQQRVRRDQRKPVV